jgi:D-lactate dehydrogenase (cytochrome)
MATHRTLGTSPRANRATLDECLNRLKHFLGDRLSTNDSVRQSHGQDESWFLAPPPDAVVAPASTEEVSAILRTCSEYGVPVVPFGVGTSLEGHVLAVQGGICIDFTNLNEVEEIRVDDLDVTVQAGVTREELEEKLRTHGLFFPVDPGANATIGGMVATGASGTTTVGYGAMRENVLGLEVVLADGRVVRTSRRARKSSAGYDLTRLFLGSEGTLGIITRVWLRVYGIPERISAAVCQFSSVSEAVRTAIQVLQVGIPVARMELLDASSMRALNRFDETLEEAEAPMLFLEFHGSGNAVAEQAEAVEEIASDNGALSFKASDDQAERSRLWHARHNAYFASLALRPGARAITTDVCVPISRLAECIDATNADLAGTEIISTIVGHVGDGNFHVMMLIDPEASDEMSAAGAIHERLVKRALSMDGTSTGEHGIGLGKMSYLEDELPAAVEVMRQIKETLDPEWILNPGKVVKRDLPP